MSQEEETSAPASEVLDGSPLAERDGGTFTMAGYGTPGFYGDALFDDKGRTNFIKEVVSQARKSPEYARYRSFLIENADMDRCAVMTGLSAEDVGAAGLELHHFPMGLYDIAELVLGQMQHNEERITTFSVANRVMAYHWRGMVGLVPLTETAHELAHTGQLFINPRSIYGNWQDLLDENRHGISEHLAAKLGAIFGAWDSGEAQNTNAHVLQLRMQQWVQAAPTVALMLSPPGEELPDGDAIDG